MKIKNIKMIDVSDWDNLVKRTYNKTYSFQQQDGCQDRGIINITIPDISYNEAKMNDKIPYVINGEKMGVKFKVWLNTSTEEIDAKFEDKNGKKESYPGANLLFWERNFYPDLQTVANDLHEKGLVESGDYTINIDW